MSAEQELLTHWRSLPQEKQQEVLDFVEFLHLKNSANKPPLVERLREIRSKIVDSGQDLLNEDEIEKELASRRGGLTQQKTPEELGWPPGFFEQTAGCLADDPIQRYPQGEYEQREQLD
ncbi:DUF2281 domain-containing protein [Nostoc sp.]|uniref:DUF2281 domain-containing protein n=1 Tax=Nostoc sp. TaxID=1180 RepID=UPI002FFAA306